MSGKLSLKKSEVKSRPPSIEKHSIISHPYHAYLDDHTTRPPLEATAGSTALLPTSSGYARCYLFRELVVAFML